MVSRSMQRVDLKKQLMHLYQPSAAIARIHARTRELGYRLGGQHHEIYLGGPRRTDPTKLKTILRQPVEQLSSVKPPQEA